MLHNLLYKTHKSDGRLIRSTLERAGFRYTDSHDWNVLWMGSNAKGYVYSGLNEFQRVNHFPCSNELTRKDRM